MLKKSSCIWNHQSAKNSFLPTAVYLVFSIATTDQTLRSLNTII